MKNLIQKVSYGVAASFVAISALLLPFTSFASAPTWTATAPAGIAFECGGVYLHTIDTVSQSANGTLSGTGSYDLDNSYTWNLTGSVTGNTVSMTITYTGTSAGSVYNLTGTIAADGSVSGTVDSNCQTFTMLPGSFVPVEVEIHTPGDREDCKKQDREEANHRNQEKRGHHESERKEHHR